MQTDPSAGFVLTNETGWAAHIDEPEIACRELGGACILNQRRSASELKYNLVVIHSVAAGIPVRPLSTENVGGLNINSGKSA
jgi:hypothetical protein